MPKSVVADRCSSDLHQRLSSSSFNVCSSTVRNPYSWWTNHHTFFVKCTHTHMGVFSFSFVSAAGFYILCFAALTRRPVQGPLELWQACQLSHSRSRYYPWPVSPYDMPHSRLLTKYCIPSIGYIGEFEIIDDHRSNKIVIELTGRLNKCGVISPRFDVEYGEIEKWIVNLLPSRQFGHIILSTTYGIMTHEEARRKKTGGKILGFFY